MTTKDILDQAAEAAAQAIVDVDDKGTNGSEAWHYVQLRIKGQRKLQNDLKAIGAQKDYDVDKDYYYGYIITSNLIGLGFYKAEAWCRAFAHILNENGIYAYAKDRLL